MKFVVAIEPGQQKTAWGVVIPDLPGCFSAGDDLESALDHAVEAIETHIAALINDGEPMPAIKPAAEHFANPDYKGWVWGVVDVPVEKYWGPAEKINITMPALLLKRIDEYVASHHTSRSGFLAEAAQRAMAG